MKLKDLKIYYPAYIVLITLLCFSYLAYYQARQTAVEKRERLFNNRVQSVTGAIKLRIMDYVQVLRGCQGLFYGSDTITARDWKVYIENLDVNNIYPGIQGIGYAPYIPVQERTNFERKLRQNGLPSFTIRSSAQNSYLTPIIYLEPASGRNLRAFGYDMYDNEARRKAMNRAIITGQPSMTSKVTLVQETAENVQPGFLLYMPVYHNPLSVNSIAEKTNNIKGFVYYPFRAYDLLTSINESYNDIELKIYDGSLIESSLLFNSGTIKDKTKQDPKKAAEFRELVSLQVAGRPWKILVSSTGRTGSGIENSQPLIIFLFGIILSGLFFVMIYNIIQRNSRMSEELRLTKELDHKKDEFIGIASHELKTPLTSIKAYMQLLERADLKQVERNLVVKANSNINKLNNLIGDLLDVTKLQSGQLRLNVAPFELKKMITESVENVQHMYSSHELIIRGEIPDLTIEGDILRLEQAMNNLLLNAIKYSPGSASVYIKADVMKNEVRVAVTDQGIGISKENQERIFGRFYRAKELSPVISGLGMGLFISQEIINRHKGTLGVESEPGKGSTFYILLPLATFES